jgi:hypothetical protein
MFDFEDLRLLAALEQAKSLSGAARRIRVNHASAWRRLGVLKSGSASDCSSDRGPVMHQRRQETRRYRWRVTFCVT